MDPDAEDDFIGYGEPLPEIEDDEIPKKKCIRPEDQIVTDEKGRRRFHGAFMGGFSAGYYNTVGSVEGWNPSSFQSSRATRSLIREQQPEDFMDKEDLGQFGIAPRKIHATKDFSDKDHKEKPNKRAFPAQSEGPIPGIPPLKNLVVPSRDTIGIRLLKKMGWRHGQGIGPRVSKKQKKIANRKVYSCALPGEENEDSDDEYAANFTFAPDDIEEVPYIPKTNLQGLGYTGLSKNPVLGSHFSLFGSAPIKIGTNKKLNIKGQAFGVGVYEDEDEDIYTHEDLSQYDFSLEEPVVSKGKNTSKPLESSSSLHQLEKLLEGFQIGKALQKRKHYPLPSLPQGFKPIHDIPSSDTHVKTTETKGLDRHLHSSSERSVMIGEKKIVSVFDLISAEDKKRLESIKQSLHSPPETNLKLIKSNPPETKPEPLVEEHSREVSSLPKTDVNFKPFAADPAKQKRYEQFLHMLETKTKEKYSSVQPSFMTEWEKVREREEFQKAARLYQPLAAGIASRFVSAANNSNVENIIVNADETKEEKTDIIKAVEQKQFGSLTREKVVWHPDKLLCKRFNVPDPYPDSSLVNVPKAKKEKVSIFTFVPSLTGKENVSEKTDSYEVITSAAQETSEDLNQETEETGHVKQPNITVSEKNKEAVDQTEDTLARPPMDLFKAIFQSSDEDSDDNSSEDMESKTKKTESLPPAHTQQQVISSSNSEDIITDPTSHGSANYINQKTDTNKALPMQGVFANIDFDELCKQPKSQNNKEETVTKSDEPPALNKSSLPQVPDESMLYGPKLPPRISYSGDENILLKPHKKNKKHKKHKHKHRHKHKKSKSNSESENEVQILKKLKNLVPKK